MQIKDILYRQKENIKIAIEYLDEKISYKELNKRVSDISQEILKKSQYLHCNNMGIFLPNSILYAMGYFSIAYLDKIIVPMEISLSKLQFQSIVNYCEIGTIMTEKAYFETIKRYCEDFQYDLELFLIDINKIVVIKGKEKRKVLEKVRDHIDENDVAIMLHTSGTTSDPKKVMLSHKNIITNIESNIASLNLNENDKTLIVLPMFFGYCNSSQFLTHLYLGASIVIAKQPFNPINFLKLIDTKKCTNTTCVPSMLFLIINMNKKYDTSSLRYLCFGGGLMPVDKLHKIIEYFNGTGIVQTYGQTEASPRVTCLLPEDSLRKIGSVGKSIPNVKVNIFDEDDKPVKVGEKGEIVVQGDNVMVGYYKHEDITEKTKRNGWLHTGDIGKFDEEGYLYIVGRIKNMIISGGLNIYPEEIEEVLINHPDVKDVVVTGEKHDILGEVPVVRIVTGNDKLKAYDIVEYCSKYLDKNKTPKKVIFCNELKKTYTGKIVRKNL